jgi:tryptophan-rich sensory protein
VDAVSRSIAALAGFVLLCVVGGAASGLATPPGDWYASIAKPPWTPPPWLFGPVWTLLYLMMGVAAWLLWLRRSEAAGRRALWLFLAQLALNFAWTPAFFGLRSPGLALAIIVALAVAIVATIAAAWRVRRTAAALLVPYLAWVSFATALNLSIWRLNQAP